jgi:ABC-2 type transport system permease protein
VLPTAVPERSAADTGLRPLGPVATYFAVLAMWARSAAAYRTSLLILIGSSTVLSSLDLLGALIIMGNVHRLAGFTLPEVLYIVGTAQTSFVISDLLFTGTEYLATRIRMGTFDSLLIRPVGVLAQVFADQWTPRRLAPLVSAGTALGFGVALAPVHWTVLRVLMVPYTILGGIAIFAGVWVFVGAYQVVVTDGQEVMNAFTYGGRTATSYPLAVYGRNALLFLTFGFPIAFVNWLPTLYVLDHPDPLGLPGWFRFAAPLVAVVLGLLAHSAWRAALRRHRSTGS